MEKIDKRKDRGPSKKTTNRWLRNLRNIKNEIDLKNHTSLQILTSVHEINNYWVTFLYKKNIVYKGKEGFLKWNEKIPVTVLLINSFRLFFEECKLNRKSKHLIKLNNNLKQKEMQSPILSLNQKENSSNMERKDRRESKVVTAKWLRNLNNIKSEIFLTKCTTLQKIMAKYSMDSCWIGFLYSNNIVYKGEDGFLKWNEKIPVTVLLINKFRDYRNQKVNQYPSTIKKQKEMQSPTPPPPIKKRGSYKKTIEPKVTIEKPKTQIVFSAPIKKVGLIRSFWRWLY